MISNGCFPFTDDASDVKYSDYIDAFGDVAAVAETMTRKLENPQNEDLATFRELRGYTQANANDE